MNASASRRTRSAVRLARGLGWLSIGLGVAELLAPRALARATGLRGDARLVQAYGVREIATGIGLLLARDPKPWLWLRVGGDALDLVTLGSRGDPREAGTAAALGAVAGVTALDLAAARSLQAARHAGRPVCDYSDRSGLPRPAHEMRGAALDDFEPPDDMRTPVLLRPIVTA